MGWRSFFPQATCLVTVGLGLFHASLEAQSSSARPTKPPIEKVADNIFRIGTIRVDTATHEMSIAGKVNKATILEFVANTKGGRKAYESAIELDTDAITFNTACALIGLDQANAVRPIRHFDPRPPDGDPVEISVSWQENGETRRINAEQLLYDREKKKVLSNSRWVYTGSVILESGQYLADVEGALIGFVHTPAPIIENVASDAVGRYGAMILNHELGLKPETPVTLTVKAILKR